MKEDEPLKYFGAVFVIPIVGLSIAPFFHVPLDASKTYTFLIHMLYLLVISFIIFGYFKLYSFIENRGKEGKLKDDER